MTSPTCLFCGYPRSVPVAGCDHATLPTVGEEMANAFRAMEPLEVVQSPADLILRALGWLDVAELRGAYPAAEVDRDQRAAREALTEIQAENVRVRRDGARLADEVAVLVKRRIIDSRSPAADALLDFRDPPSTPRADRLAELDAQAAILGPELVDLQHQVVAQQEALATAQRELEQERREAGRLRADLENAQQLLAEVERGPSVRRRFLAPQQILDAGLNYFAFKLLAESFTHADAGGTEGLQFVLEVQDKAGRPVFITFGTERPSEEGAR
jgi:hypothetical protein